MATVSRESGAAQYQPPARRPAVRAFRHGASRTRTGDLLGAIQPSSHVESASFAALYGRAPGVPQHLPQQSAPRLAEARDPGQAAGAIEKERGRAPPGKEGVDGSSPSEGSAKAPQ